MKTLEQQLAAALNAPTKSPAFAIFSGQPLEVKKSPISKINLNSRVRIREDLEGATSKELERLLFVAQDMLAQERVRDERKLAVADITAQLYNQYCEYWFNYYDSFNEFINAFKGGLV